MYIFHACGIINNNNNGIVHKTVSGAIFFIEFECKRNMGIL